MKNYLHHSKEEIRDYFLNWAAAEPSINSPFYFQLALHLAKDDYLLNLAAHSTQGQPMANLIFASVQYLLLQKPSADLAKYYPSISDNPLSLDESGFALFKQFCKNNETEIKSILETKMVQTNAINRCAYLFPIISSFAFHEKIDKLNIVDIGCSAGLNLLFDRYQYTYDTNGSNFGDSPIIVKTALKGKTFPQFQKPPKINRRIGIDINPLDLRIKKDADWLKALIWPDHSKRISRMNKAIELATENKLEYRKGKTTAFFKETIQSLPKDEALCVFHTHALYQFKKPERQEFYNLMDELGKEYHLLYLGVEGIKAWKEKHKTTDTPVQTIQYKDGQKIEKLAATTTGHADWVQFE